MMCLRFLILFGWSFFWSKKVNMFVVLFFFLFLIEVLSGICVLGWFYCVFMKFNVGGEVDYRLYFFEVIVVLLVGDCLWFCCIDCFCCDNWFFFVVFVFVVNVWFNLFCLGLKERLNCE